VHTTDNGIQVYQMINATNLGALQMTYTKDDIDVATGYTGQYWGFDLTQDRKEMVVAGSQGAVFDLAARIELPTESFVLTMALSNSDVVLSWPGSITGAVIQSSAKLVPANFVDLSPQPTVTQVQNRNQATLRPDQSAVFYRLRK